MNYILNDNVILRKVENEFFILKADHQSVISFNEIGGMVLEFLSTKKSQQEIVLFIVEFFDVSLEIAKKDLKIFLDQLILNEIILISN